MTSLPVEEEEAHPGPSRSGGPEPCWSEASPPSPEGPAVGPAGGWGGVTLGVYHLIPPGERSAGASVCYLTRWLQDMDHGSAVTAPHTEAHQLVQYEAFIF